MRGVTDIAPIAIPALGLSFLWPYFRASFLSFLTVFGVHPAELVQLAYPAYVATFACAAVFAIVGSRPLERWLCTARARIVLGVLGAGGNAVLWICGNGGLAVVGCIAGTAAATLFFTGSLLGYGLSMAPWDARQAALTGFLSFGIGFLDNVALALGMPVSAAFCVLTPIISVVCMPDAPTDSLTNDVSSGPKGSISPTLFALMILLALFCVTGNVVRGLTSPWFTHEGPTVRTLYMSLANLAFAMLSIVLLCHQISVRKVLFWNWTGCMVLFFIGLLGITFLQGPAVRLGSDIATVSRVCFTLLMFLFSLESHQWTDRGLAHLMGLFLLLPEALSACIRHVVVPRLLALTGVDPLAASSYVGVGIILVLIVAMAITLGNLLLKQASHGSTVATPHDPAAASAPNVLDQVARDYGLTAREVQTASYVSKGYSLEKTADLLGISINTVRTHMRSVYSKLDIHSRQELIDLLDSMRP